MPEFATLNEAVIGLDLSMEKYARMWHARYPQVPVDDLFQAARAGTVKAWARFDPGRGAKLITFAAFWWRREVQAVVKAHVEFGMRHLPRGKGKGKNGIVFAGVVSDSALGDGNQSFIDGVFAARPEPESRERAEEDWTGTLGASRPHLTDKEYAAVAMRFGAGRALKQIAARLGVSPARARQLVANAVDKLGKSEEFKRHAEGRR